MTKSRLLKFAQLIKCISEQNTDKGILVSEGDIAVGSEVFINDENGDLVPAVDGVYETDTMSITVESGIVKAIEEKVAEEEPKTEEPMAEEGGEPTEPTEPKDEPKDDDKDAKIAELEKALEEANAKLDEAENKIAELEAKIKEPVEDPIEPQFSKMQKDADKMTKHFEAVANFKLGK